MDVCVVVLIQTYIETKINKEKQHLQQIHDIYDIDDLLNCILYFTSIRNAAQIFSVIRVRHFLSHTSIIFLLASKKN